MDYQQGKVILHIKIDQLFLRIEQVYLNDYKKSNHQILYNDTEGKNLDRLIYMTIVEENKLIFDPI